MGIEWSQNAIGRRMGSHRTGLRVRWSSDSRRAEKQAWYRRGITSGWGTYSNSASSSPEALSRAFVEEHPARALIRVMERSWARPNHLLDISVHSVCLIRCSGPWWSRQRQAGHSTCRRCWN